MDSVPSLENLHSRGFAVGELRLSLNMYSAYYIYIYMHILGTYSVFTPLLVCRLRCFPLITCHVIDLAVTKRGREVG